MPRWAAFAGITVAVLIILLVLARTSQEVLTGDGSDRSHTGAPPDERLDGPGAGPGEYPNWSDEYGRGSADPESDRADPGSESPDTGRARTSRDGRVGPDPPVPGEAAGPGTGPTGEQSMRSDGLSTRLLLVNVAISQGILWIILLAGAWYAQVPPRALGIGMETAPFGPRGLQLGVGAWGGLGVGGGIGTGRLADVGLQVAVGVGFGLAIAVANTVGAAGARAFGFDPSEELRELLAPETAGEWALLLAVVLPVIAGFEEFLFRAAVVGALSVGFGVSPWVLAVVSSVVFAVGHGAQGTLGVIVTGVLGFVLAAGFVLTGSLLVVVVAHYLVNAGEFVVYEGLGVDPLGD